MKYTAPLEKDIFIRKGDNGAGIIYDKTKGRQLVLNKTGINISEIAFDSSSSQEVLQRVAQMYPNIETEVLENDIKELMKILSVFHLIKWNKDDEDEYNCFFQLESKDKLFRIAGEEDYEVVSDFIEKIGFQGEKTFSVAQFEQYYDIASIRFRSFGLSECYAYCVENGQVKAVLAFTPPSPSSLVLSLVSFFFLDELSNDDVKSILYALIVRILPRFYHRIAKVRISATEKSYEKLEVFINALEMSKEAYLPDETTDGSVTFYSQNVNFFVRDNKSS